MSDVIDDLDPLNELLGAIPLECEGMMRHLTAWQTARTLHGIGPGDIVGDPPAHGRSAASDELCPCGSGRTYGRCCGAH